MKTLSFQQNSELLTQFALKRKSDNWKHTKNYVKKKIFGPKGKAVYKSYICFVLMHLCCSGLVAKLCLTLLQPHGL